MFVNELRARISDLHLVCLSPYWPAACAKAALRGRTHDCTRSSPKPFKNLLHRRGHPHMTKRSTFPMSGIGSEADTPAHDFMGFDPSKVR